MSSRRQPIKAVFNIAQSALAMATAIIAYRSLGGVSLFEVRATSLYASSSSLLLPFVALVGCYFVANTLAVSGAIAASSDVSVLKIWKQNTRSTLVYDVLSGAVVFLFGWVYVKVGPLGALGLAAPLLGARQLYKTNRQLEQVNEELLQLMVKAIEARDPYTSGHSRRVAQYSTIIAKAVGLNAHEVERIGVAALLHDVGKIHEIYAPILRKPGKLTSEEWAIMKTHPIKSAELVTTVSGLRDIVGAVRSHHENWDGTGYPDMLAGAAIPLGARVIKFADTIDAMTTDRPYRPAMGPLEVRSELEKFRGIQFDPEICDRLLASPSFQLLFTGRRSEEVPAVRSTPVGKSRLRVVSA
ncbi:MAG TPA: HD-GYP domain-containing protein [Gemmatimonadaceae bacterium]|nr:HD-GYP domain-containing protein [Gemmatimonadaceae bacterium]